MTAVASPPTDDSLIETDPRVPTRAQPFFMAKAWIIWVLQSLLPRLAAAPEVLLVNKEYANQNTAIGTTSLPTGPLSAGVYEVSYTLRVTTADGVASSVQMTLGWTDNGGPALTLNAAALVADSTTLPQTGFLRATIAANSTLTFATAYASTTAGKMKYKAQFSVIRVGSV